MPRIAGVDIPPKKPILYGLLYIYGIGLTLADKILKEVEKQTEALAKALTDIVAA